MCIKCRSHNARTQFFMTHISRLMFALQIEEFKMYQIARLIKKFEWQTSSI